MKSVSRRDVLFWMASALPASVVVSRMGNDVLLAATEHPRLLFTSDNIPAIRAKLTAHYGSELAHTRTFGAASSRRSPMLTATSERGPISPTHVTYAAVYAFLSQILPCPGYYLLAHAYAAWARGRAAAPDLGPTAGSVGGAMAGGWPESMLGYAYDWAYRLLSARRFGQGL